MKISKTLLILVIGLLSLNLIFAGSITKQYRITGDLVITPALNAACSGGTGTWSSGTSTNDTGIGGNLSQGNLFEKLFFAVAPSGCTLEIYSPNNQIVYSNSNLTAELIKSGLKNGIITGFIAPITTTTTLDFKVKIKQDTSPSYLLETTIVLPNPNVTENVIGADKLTSKIEGTQGICNSNSKGDIMVVDGVLKQCSSSDVSSGSYVWTPINNGTGGSGLVLSDFLPTQFTACPNAGCYINGTQYSQTAGKIKLKSGAIIGDNIAIGAINLNHFSEEVMTYLDNLQFNITNVTNEYLDISNESIEIDHLSSDLRNRIGSLETDNSASGLTAVTGKYYMIYDGNGNTYYVPIYASNNFGAFAFRNLLTYQTFDSTWERKTGAEYSSTYPPEVGYKVFDYAPFPDYTQNSSYRPDRRHIGIGKYVPIDLRLSSGGPNQNYKVTIKECTMGYSDSEHEYLGYSDPSGWSDCSDLSSAIVGATIGETLSNNFTVTTDSSGSLTKRIHIKKMTTKKGILVIYTNLANPSSNKARAAATIMNFYNNSSDIDISQQACTYTVVPGIVPFTSTTYNIHVQYNAWFSTQSAGYYYWCANVGLESDPTTGCIPGNYNYRQTPTPIWITSDFTKGTAPTNIKINMTTYDIKTGSRFSKTFLISGCTLQS
ncbi:MAG: hypothetical protein WCX82_04285 [archaeon]|jgi:hypothetical protein